MVVVAFESAVVGADVLVAEVSDAHRVFTLDDGEAQVLLDELLLVVRHVLHVVLVLVLGPDPVGALMPHVGLVPFEKHILVQDLRALLPEGCPQNVTRFRGLFTLLKLANLIGRINFAQIGLQISARDLIELLLHELLPYTILLLVGTHNVFDGI